MRRVFVVAALSVLAVAGAFAATRADFDRVVDFSVTLKTLAAAADGTAPVPAGKIVVLSGTANGITIVTKDQASFQVTLQVITGEWIGTEDVKAYSCLLTYTGPEYFKVFPARAPANGTPDVVVQGTRIMVVGRVTGITTLPSGQKIAAVEGYAIRVIE